MQLVNLNRHAVELHLGDQEPTVLPGIGDASPRLTVEQVGQTTVELSPGVLCPVVVTRTLQDTSLPEPRVGVLFVISQLMCLAHPERRDLCFPYPVVTYPNGHSHAGQPLYATGLGQVPPPS